MQECFSAEIFAEMSDTHIGRLICIFIKIRVVESPVMGQVGAYQDHVPGLESLHVVSDELGALSSSEMYQFHF